MKISATFVSYGLEELLEQIYTEIPYKTFGRIDFVNQIGAIAEVEGNRHLRFVHREDEKAVAFDTCAVLQSLGGA